MKAQLAKFFGVSKQEASEPALGSDEEIIHLPVKAISPNPFQPRKVFKETQLEELAQSIREHGVLQPVVVRKAGEGYELVAGERRLRASKLAGLTTIPAIVRDFSDREAAELALIENLQREDLNFLEEAEGYAHLLESFGFTQEELAKRVGKSQSTIANKLRLLKLPEKVRVFISREMSITERHARAILRLPDEKSQLAVLAAVVEKELTVRQTEELVEKTLLDISQEIAVTTQPATPSQQKIIKIFKDIRIFLNTIYHAVDEMKGVGLHVEMRQTDHQDHIEVVLRIPKRR